VTDEPEVASLFELYPGVEAMEREAYDLFGHPLRRPPRHDPHPHARGLGGPPAAQGLRHRAPDDETMIINMGPQHPSTHGVLRLMLELDGETVLRTKPVIGYLHTGMEKTAEELTYVQGSTNVTRMDYLSPLHNELVLSWPSEALLGVELPPRAVWIRMLMVELNRVSSHLMWMATNGMDLGSTSMMIYGFREREMVLAFFEKTTGLRMNHNFIRPGGTAADLPDGWEDDVTVICDTVLEPAPTSTTSC
jgi:NADH-quinone oxidoreductase subunit D